MATLKFAAETCMLPPPSSPTRTCLPTTQVALRNLGFDSSFDLALERTADAIHSSEVNRQKRLEAALMQARAARALEALPCAFVRLSKAPREDADPAAVKAEAVAALAGAIAGGAGQQAVKAEDVHVDLREDALRCDVHIRGGTLLGVFEALTASTKDRGGGIERGDHSGVHRAFVEVGGPEDLAVKIVLHWPVEHCRTAMRLAYPEYEVPLTVLEHILQVAAACRSAFAEVWGELEKDPDERDAAPGILAHAAMASFAGELLATSEGRRLGLAEDFLTQEATSLSQLAADSRQAQAQLKELLAPGSEWAKAELNDIMEVPLSHASRKWQAGPEAILAEGEHFDLGAGQERQLFDAAKERQRPEQEEAPVGFALDASRLRVTFAALKDLNAAVGRIVGGEDARFDVVWVENGWQTPSPLGHRCISIGLRQRVGNRSHISTLELQHKALLAVQQSTEVAKCVEIKALLSECGVGPRDLDKVMRKSLAELSCTAWQAARGRLEELLSVAAFAREVIASGSPPVERQLAEALINEVAAQALAAVPEAQVTAARGQ